MTCARTWRAGLVVPLLVLAGGCEGRDQSSELARALTRWTFVMGHRGEGIVTFQASSEINGSQTGECRDAVCRTNVDDMARLTLTPVPAAGFRFRAWDGDSASRLSCPLEVACATAIIKVTVAADGACVAVFEPGSSPTTPTTPGVSR